MIVLIVFVSDAERRIPIQYSKRVVGRKVYGGQSTHLPMKVNMQMVRLIRDGETVKVSKRTGKALTLNDLMMKADSVSSTTRYLVSTPYFFAIEAILSGKCAS